MNIPTITHNGLSFINLNKPTEEQMLALNKNFGFSLLNLEDYLYKTQIPKIETYKDYSLLVLDIPYIPQAVKQKEPANKPLTNVLTGHIQAFPKVPSRKRINLGEVDFFIGKDYLVVLHDEKTPQIDELFEMCKITSKHREDVMGKGANFLLYRIVDVLVDSSFAYVDSITNAIDSIDRQLEEKSSAHVIDDIYVTRRNIVVFETMIKPALPIFADLEKGKYVTLNGTMTPYWSNILDHVQKIWDRLEDNRELIEGISRSHESLLTVRTNETMRVLTAFTAVLLPLTLVASIYGMNVPLPFQTNVDMFAILLVLMTIIAIVMVVYFKIKNWF